MLWRVYESQIQHIILNIMYKTVISSEPSFRIFWNLMFRPCADYGDLRYPSRLADTPNLLCLFHSNKYLFAILSIFSNFSCSGSVMGPSSNKTIKSGRLTSSTGQKKKFAGGKPVKSIKKKRFANRIQLPWNYWFAVWPFVNLLRRIKRRKLKERKKWKESTRRSLILEFKCIYDLVLLKRRRQCSY